MKVLIVGTGVIGTIYGWALSNAGHKVVHYVRSGRSKNFKNGIEIDMLDNRRRHKKRIKDIYSPGMTESATTDGEPYGIVIVPTKPYQVISALNNLVPTTGNADYLLLTQNWDGTSEIDRIIDRNKYIYGDAKAGGAFKGNRLIAVIYNSIDIGQTQGLDNDCLKSMTGLFKSIGLKPIIHKNILEYIRVQYAVNAGLWPPVVRSGGIENLLKDKKNGTLTLLAVKECLMVIDKMGVDLKLYPETSVYLNDSKIGRSIALLMLKFLFKYNESVIRSSLHALGDPREIKESYDNLRSSGKRLGVDMPVMDNFDEEMEKFAVSLQDKQ
jgi:2-dehydropantoate 2-reductase